MEARTDTGQDLAKDFDRKLSVNDHQRQTVAAQSSTAAQTISQSGQPSKRDRLDADDSDAVLPAQKRIRLDADTHGTASSSRRSPDPLNSGISDADLNKLYDNLLKTNPEFARREAAALETSGTRGNTIDVRTEDRSRTAGRDF